MQFMSVKNIEDHYHKIVLTYLFGGSILGDSFIILKYLLFCFRKIQPVQQPNQYSVMQQFFCHELFTPVTSFSSTMSTDLLSMQVCFICEP